MSESTSPPRTKAFSGGLIRNCHFFFFSSSSSLSLLLVGLGIDDSKTVAVVAADLGSTLDFRTNKDVLVVGTIIPPARKAEVETKQTDKITIVIADTGSDADDIHLRTCCDVFLIVIDAIFSEKVSKPKKKGSRSILYFQSL
mmetsp:Transcript_30927/g.45846  ORF Transcript_30927/g.45846 Transcript_30927/m.45846 type:complete len:142 (+) Transcript_30927:915-1340(+)